MKKEWNFVDIKYSEEEIRNYINNNPKKLDLFFWHNISVHQNLSEEFIKEFKDFIWWFLISQNQYMSEEFMIEFIDKIEVGGGHTIMGIINNKKIPEDVRKRIIALKKVVCNNET